MPLPILPSVFEALGRSFIWEEGLGNFRSARLPAEAACLQATEPEAQAWAYFTRGIVELLSGRLHRARRSWDRSASFAYQNESLELLLATFRHLADYEQWNTKLDGSGAEAVEINARWDVGEVMRSKIPHLTTLRQECKDQEAQNLAWMLSEIFGTGKSIRSTAQHWPSASFSEEGKTLFRQALQSMENSSRVAQEQQLSAYIVFPQWLRADILRRSQQHEQAFTALQAAEEAARIQNDDVRTAMCLLSRGDWQSAPFSTPAAWDFAVSDSSQESSTLNSMIEVQEFNPIPDSAWQSARIHYDQAAALFAKAGAERGVAQTYLRQAYLSVRADAWAAAAKQVAAAEAIFRKMEDFRGVMLARTHQLLIGFWQEEWDGLHHQARIIGRWGCRSGDFSFVHSLGTLINRFARHLFLRHGRFEAARRAYQAAQSLFTALEAPLNATQNIVDLALLHEAVGDFTTAQPELRAAAGKYMSLADQPPPCWSLPAAVRPFLLQHAIMLASQSFNISNGLMDWKQMEAARNQLKAFVELLNPSGLLPAGPPENLDEMRIVGMTQLAHSVDEDARILIPYYRFKLDERANHELTSRKFWEEAFQATENLPGERRLFYQTVLWGAIRNYPEAIAAYGKYQELRGAQLPTLPAAPRKDTASVHEDDLDLTKHRFFWEQTFSMWVKLKQYPEARQAWQQRCALEDDAWWERAPAPWRIGSSVAEMYEGLGDYEQALSFCHRTLALFDERRNELSRDELKTAIANDRGAQFLYHQGARLAFRRNDPAAAFFYIERGKARALLDLLSAHPDRLSLAEQQQSHVQQWREYNARLQAFRGLLAIERRRGGQDAERLRQLEQDIAVTTTRLEILEALLLREIPSFFTTVGGSGKTLGIPELQAFLGKDQLFIGYSYYEEDLFLFAVNQHGLVTASHRQVARRKIEKLAIDLHESCQKKAPFTEAAGQLADYLLDPLRECLEDHQQLYFAPAGSLYLVPFQLLPFKGKPLGESHIISFLPSASTLQYFSAVSLNSASQLLVIGNPTGDLNAAAAEANFIAQLFKTKALLGPAATEQAVRQAIPRANMLHLATHGFLSEEAPLASSLALAHNTSLTLYELMGMQLEAELVVLSACETGKGTTTSGDDVLGLTRGLLAAGAKSAVVSFWSVDDASTALFMQYFYEHLKRENSPAKALAYAQRKLRSASKTRIFEDFQNSLRQLTPKTQRSLRGIKLERDATEDGYEHPFYWAPFFYVGKL